MENTLHIVFEGNSIERDIFLSENFAYRLTDFLKGTIHQTLCIHFAMFAKEIVKNIYDHADGLGEATFELKNNCLTFEIKDYGTHAYNLEELKAGGTTKDTPYNKGIGLKMMIPDMAEALGVSLQVDCSHGFIYKGTWDYSIK